MNWQRRLGLWTLGSIPDAPAPLVQVLEARGAVLEWPVDAPVDQPPAITVTDPAEADWLWQLIGEPAHVALLTGPAGDDPIAVSVAWQHPLIVLLRKAAHGLWLRTWWPTSPRDGIAALPAGELDAELAEVVAEVDDIVDDELLPRLTPQPVATRADYALAASGRAPAPADRVIASGTAAMAWQGVPGGVIDAGEQPVRWTVDAAPRVVVRIMVHTTNEPGPLLAGLAVSVRLPPGEAVSTVLDAAGTAEVELPISAAEAWAADWDSLQVVVGTEVAEEAGMRARVRDLARGRRTIIDAISYRAEADDDY